MFINVSVFMAEIQKLEYNTETRKVTVAHREVNRHHSAVAL